MKQRRRRLLALAAALGLLVALLPVVRVARGARRALRPAHKRVSALDRKHAVALLGRLEDVELVTADGVRLRAWFSPGPKRSAVVFSHGGGGNRLDLLSEAAVLAHHGHGVLLLDHRATGESEGDLVTWGDRERWDVAAAVNWLAARPDVDPGLLGVLGFSVGSTTAALAAVADPRLRAVALGPIWPSLEEEIDDKFPRWRAPLALAFFRLAGVDVAAVRPIDVIGRLSGRAVFFFHGTLDQDTPVRVMERVVAQLPGAERWLVEGAGHGGYGAVDPAGLEAQFGSFFDRALPLPERGR